MLDKFALKSDTKEHEHERVATNDQDWYEVKVERSGL